MGGTPEIDVSVEMDIVDGEAGESIFECNESRAKAISRFEGNCNLSPKCRCLATASCGTNATKSKNTREKLSKE